MVLSRIARILSGVLVLLLVGGPCAGVNASAETARLTGRLQTAVSEDVASDTTYIARLDTLTVVGHQDEEATTATVARAGKAEGGASAPATTGQTRGPSAGAENVAADGVTIGGLIVNETFSVIGARFARAFNDKWTEPEGVKDLGYTMTLGENPAPRRGAQVFVEVEGTTLFQGYLRPNRRQIRQAARQAVRRATVYLQKYYEPREVY